MGSLDEISSINTGSKEQHHVLHSRVLDSRPKNSFRIEKGVLKGDHKKWSRVITKLAFGATIYPCVHNGLFELSPKKGEIMVLWWWKYFRWIGPFWSISDALLDPLLWYLEWERGAKAANSTSAVFILSQSFVLKLSPHQIPKLIWLSSKKKEGPNLIWLWTQQKRVRLACNINSCSVG